MKLAHVAAFGARTPVGSNAEASAAAVRAGIVRLVEHPRLLDPSGDAIRLAMDAHLDPEWSCRQRISEMAISALVEVAEKLSTSGYTHHISCEVHVALPEARPGWSSSDATYVIDHVAQTALPGLGRMSVHRGLAGHAAALATVGEQARRIAEGQLDLCLIGGVDSYLDLATLDWLYENRQLNCENIRSGFSPGEGAGFVALASLRALRSLGMPSLGAIAGAHSAMENRLIKTDEVNLGWGLTDAVAGATRNLRFPRESCDSIFCDINGERYRSEEWGFLALKLPRVCRDATAYEAPSMNWGDVGAASGALLALLAVQGWRRGYAKGPRALLWAGSEAGLRAAVVLEQPSTEV